MPKSLLLAVLAPALAGCSSMAVKPIQDRSAPEPSSGSAWASAWSEPPPRSEPAAGPALRAMQPAAQVETGVVRAREPGVVQTSPEIGHDVGAGEGRTYILELYQKVIEERDDLVRRVAALEAERGKLRESLGQGARRIAELEQRESELEGANATLTAQAEELGERLLTAQVRRLEAEKMLLETKLETLRQREREEALAIGTAGEISPRRP